MAYETSDFLIVLITGSIVDKLQDMFEKMENKKYPVFIPIPDVESRVTAKTDSINNFVKRKTGIDFKL